MTTEQLAGAAAAVLIALVVGFVSAAGWTTGLMTERCDKLGNVLLNGVPYECRRLDGQPKRVKVMV